MVDEIEGKINLESIQLENLLPKEFFEESSGFLLQ